MLAPFRPNVGHLRAFCGPKYPKYGQTDQFMNLKKILPQVLPQVQKQLPGILLLIYIIPATDCAIPIMIALLVASIKVS